MIVQYTYRAHSSTKLCISEIVILNLACTLVDHQTNQTLQHLLSCESDGRQYFHYSIYHFKGYAGYIASSLAVLTRRSFCVGWACRLRYHLKFFNNSSSFSLLYIFHTFWKKNPQDLRDILYNLKKDYEKIIS